MSFPFETTPCRHDPEVLRDLAYDLARESVVRGDGAAGERSSAELCADCREEVARVARILKVLFELEPAKAPFALDGRVVAATQAGHRQDRVVRALESLARVEVPSELELRFRAGQMIPDELGASFGSSDEHSAPPELDERVARDLSRGEISDRSFSESSGEDRSGLSDRPLTNELARSRGLAFGALVAAAALLMLVQLRLRSEERGGIPGESRDASSPVSLANAQGAPSLEEEDMEELRAELKLSFRVKRLGSRNELDPAAREIFDQLAGPQFAAGLDDERVNDREDRTPGQADRSEEQGF